MKKAIFITALCLITVMALTGFGFFSWVNNMIKIPGEMRIATVEEQITAINGSIDDLKKVDTELDKAIDGLESELTTLEAELEANSDADAETKKALEDEIAGVKALIAALEERDAELEKKIADLEGYVDGEILEIEDWANTTFATLNHYNELITIIKELKTTVDENDLALSAQFSDSIMSAVDSSEQSMKEWVNSKLTSAYNDIAALEAQITSLQERLTSSESDIHSQLTDQKAALEIAKNELTVAYNSAISNAINSNNGIIDTKIESAIKDAKSELGSKLADIELRVVTLELQVEENSQKIAELEERVAYLQQQVNCLNGLHELTYTPDTVTAHTEGCAHCDYSESRSHSFDESSKCACGTVKIISAEILNALPEGWSNDYEINLDGSSEVNGTQDSGKTEWAEGDHIILTAVSEQYGTQNLRLDYSNGVWTPEELELYYIEDEVSAIVAAYAPYYTVSNGEIKALYSGLGEYIEASCTVADGVVKIDFSEVNRNYSRLRIAGPDVEAWEALYVNITNAVPAGEAEPTTVNSVALEYTDNNFFIYGTFTEDSSITVWLTDKFSADIINTLAVYSFTEATEPGKTYVLDATPVEADTEEELVAALENGENVILTSDITLSENYAGGIDITRDVTLDLNGHTITGNLYVLNVLDGRLTLDGEGAVNMEISGVGYSVYVTGGTVDILDGSVMWLQVDGGTANVSDGAVTALYVDGGTANVSGGAVTDLYVDGGTANVSGGSISTLYAYDGTANVSGGAVTQLNVEDGTANITGGTIEVLIVDGGTVNQAGGTISDFSVDNGTVTISKGIVTNFYVNGGTLNASDVTTKYILQCEGIVNVFSGTVDYIDIREGTLTVLDATVASLNAKGGTAGVSGGKVTDLIISDGTTTVSDGEISKATVEGGALNVTGGTFTDLRVDGGAATVSGGETVNLVVLSGTANFLDGKISELLQLVSGELNIAGGYVEMLNVEYGTVNISDGEITDMNIWNGTVTVTEGKFAGVEMIGGTLNISGGEFNSYSTICDGTVNVSGGTFEALGIVKGVVVTVTGGTFMNSDPIEYVDTTLCTVTQNEDGSWTVALI